MNKKSVPLFTLICLIFTIQSFGKKSVDQQLEQKYRVIEFAFKQGRFEEVVGESQIVIKKFSEYGFKNKFYSEIVKISALAAYHNADFSSYHRYVKILAENTSAVDKEIGLYSTLAISSVLLESHKPAEALDFLLKLNPEELSERDRKDYNLILAGIKSEQGYYNQALELLQHQVPARMKIAENISVDSVFRYLTDPEQDLIYRREMYLQVLSQQLQLLIQRGDYQLADSLAGTMIDWIKSNLHSDRYLLAKIYNLRGDLHFLNENIAAAAAAYSMAESLITCSEKSADKPYMIYRRALTELMQGNSVQADYQLRKLLIAASRNHGWNEPFQPYYELASAQRDYFSGNLQKALSRLERNKSRFTSMEGLSPVVQEYFRIKNQLLYAAGKFSDYCNNLMEQVKIREKFLGSSCPLVAQAKLEFVKASYKTSGQKDTLNEIFKTNLYLLLKSGSNLASFSSEYDFVADYFFNQGMVDSALKYSELAVRGLSKQQYNWAFAKLKYAYYQAVTGKIAVAMEVLREVEPVVIAYPSANNRNLSVFILLNEVYKVTDQADRSLLLTNKLKGYIRPTNLFSNLPELIQTNYELGVLYKDLGNLYLAEKYLSEGMKMADSYLKDSPLHFTLLLAAAEMKLLNGEVEAGHDQLEQCTQQANRFFGKKSFSSASVKKIEAEYYESISDFQNALMSVKEAEEILKSNKSQASIQYVDLLLLQARLLDEVSKNDVQKIRGLYDQSLSILKTALGEGAHKYNVALIEYSVYLIKSGNYQAASMLLDKALVYYASSGKNSVEQAKAILTFGKLNYAKKEYAKARKNFEEAADILKAVFSTNHPDYNHARAELAKALYMEKEINKSLAVLEEIIPTYLSYVEEYFPVMSFRQKSLYWNNLKDEFELYNYIIIKHFASKPEMASRVFNNLMATKAILLNSDKKIRASIASSSDTVLINIYEEWISVKEQLSRTFRMSKEEQVALGIDIVSLYQRMEYLEKEISHKSSLFASSQSKSKVNWEGVRKRLDQGEAVVEITRVRQFNHDFGQSAFYAALVLNEESHAGPLCIVLPEADLLEGKYYKYYRNTMTLKVEDEFSYQYFWSAISPALEKTRMVYFSPDGIYNQINPETFRTGKSEFLVDKYSFSFVSNSKDLYVQKADPEKKQKAQKNPGSFTFLLAGNPTYYYAGTGTIPQLEGAEAEVKEISGLVSAAGLSSKLLTGSALTEDTVKSMTGFSVLHYATHGFFLESTYEEEENHLITPLLNSGLLFANGGEVIKEANLNKREGILTAYEASLMDLTTTDLVILSACETGRGEVKNGEGVFGLQRAFLIAGSDAIIMSLFKVNDEVTRKFMFYFYQYYLNSWNKRQAFANAKAMIKKEFPDPVNWGAFIMIESNPKTSKNLAP